MNDKPIVKYNNQYWVVEKITKDMAEIWRNGQVALMPVSQLEFIK